jgi:EAL domain-containing protein (putative c-di-GMP-specific phosphodiesterase class I)/predicted transcriptional regulator
MRPGAKPPLPLRPSGIIAILTDPLILPLDPPDRWLDRLTAGEGLFIVFQPIVDLRTGDLIGHEVLGRFPSDAPEALQYGATGPSALLELAHAHGRLLALERAWRALAIEAVARRPERGSVFFLNVDPRVIDEPSFVTGFTRGLIDQLGLSPSRFVLELTEAGASLDSGRIARFVHHYSSQGFRIALDDIGAGYASLTALIRLRPHFLKLDKEIVSGLSADPLRINLVRSLADFGRRSNLQVIAEGIETERDLEALLYAGVRLGQGYLFGRPEREPLPPLASALETLRRTAIDLKRTVLHPAHGVTISTLVIQELTLLPSLLCAEAASLLQRPRGRRGLPVVGDDGTIAGLLTRDRLFSDHTDPAGGLPIAERKVHEMMDARPLCVDEGESIEQVCRLATTRDEERIHDLVLVSRGGRYAGVVTLHALLGAMIELTRPAPPSRRSPDGAPDGGM